MKKNPSSQSGLFNPRAFVAFTLCSVAALLAIGSFAAPASRPTTPTFGHPIISGIGGGDTETGVDSAGHLYFADLTLANFSTSRSDDHGATFTCSNTGVPDAVVDRQWYATDGDPTNGGSLYLTNDEFAHSPAMCGSPTNFGKNVLVMYRSPLPGGEATAGIQFGPAN